MKYLIILLGFNLIRAGFSKIKVDNETEQLRDLKLEWEIIAEFMADQYIVTMFVEHNCYQESDQILKYSIKNYRFGVFHYNNITLITKFWNTLRNHSFASIKRYGVIIIMRDIYMLNYLVKSSNNNKVVLVFFDLDVEYIKKIMKNLWTRYQQFTIISLFVTRQTGRMNQIIQHNPFQSKFYEYPVNTEKSSKQVNLFINSQFRLFLSNMCGYELKILIFEFPLVSTLIRNSTGSVVDYSGVDGEMLKISQKFMNFTPIFVTDESTKAESISALTTVRLIEEGVAEVGINGRFILDATYNNTIFLNPLDKVPLWFAVPINYKEEPLQILAYYYFDFLSRLLIVISVTLLTLIWSLGTKILKQNTESATAGIPLKVLALMHGIAIKVPRKVFNKIIFITIAAFGLFLTSIYQGTIVQQLNNPLKPNQINSLKDLLSSDLQISVLSYIQNSDLNEHGETEQTDNLIMMGELGHRKVIKFNTIAEGMDAVAYNKTTALLMPVMFHRAYPVRYFNKTTGLDLVHSIHESTVSLLVSYVIARNSPYIRIFNHIIRVFVESGAMNNQLMNGKDQQQLFYISRIKNGFIPQDENVFRSIKLTDLVLIQYMLVGGLVSSIIVFVMEHVVHFVCSKYKSKQMKKFEVVTVKSK